MRWTRDTQSAVAGVRHSAVAGKGLGEGRGTGESGPGAGWSAETQWIWSVDHRTACQRTGLKNSLQQIQGSQQIGFIENEILNTWRHLLASLNLLETRVPAVPASRKRGRERRPCASSGSTPTATWSGHGPFRKQFFFADGCCLARAGLFTEPLTTPIIRKTGKHSKKGKLMAAVKTYQGVVDNGIIRLDPEVRLPENLQVFVVVPETVDERPLQIRSPRLVHRNQLPDFAKEVR